MDEMGCAAGAQTVRPCPAPLRAGGEPGWGGDPGRGGAEKVCNRRRVATKAVAETEVGECLHRLRLQTPSTRVGPREGDCPDGTINTAP